MNGHSFEVMTRRRRNLEAFVPTATGTHPRSVVIQAALDISDACV
jgi:hypothetical protein